MIEQWRAQFADDPRQAVADLFSGRARLGASMRLDVPEILYYEFSAEQQERREQLDTALLGWLSDIRKNCQAQLHRLGFAVYARRLCDGLQSIHLLDLPRSTCQLRELQDSWLAFLQPLRVAPERDPALELLRVLTRRQPQASSPALWQRLACEQRAEYLQVALLGLQRLPLQNTTDNQRLMLHALLLHGIQQAGSPEHAVAEYRKQVQALQQRYPRALAHWAELEQQAREAIAKHPLPGRDEFLAEMDRRNSPNRRQAGRKTQKLDLPSNDEVQLLRRSILEDKQSTTSIFAQLKTMLGRLQRYASQTGDGYFLVRTLCNHGNLLLDRRPDLDSPALDWLEQQVEQALYWEPSNEFVWTFWSTLLARSGRYPQQEWVLREAVRLFPADEPSRVELARLLLRKGEPHWPEAEIWLREAAERSPTNEPSRVELARLLLRKGESHWPEAEAWLREAAERSPTHEPSRVELARLLLRKGESHWPEAEAWLREAAERNPTDEPSRVELARLLSWRGDFPAAEAQLQDFLRHHPDNEIARTALRLIRDGKALSHDLGLELAELSQPESVGSGSADNALLQQLAERSTLQVAWWQARQGLAKGDELLQQRASSGDWLAATYRQWLHPEPVDEQDVPPHAWGWRAALTFQQPGGAYRWQALQEQFPERSKETGLLRWLQSGEQTPELERFLADDNNESIKRLHAVLGKLPLEAPQRRKLAQDLTLARA